MMGHQIFVVARCCCSKMLSFLLFLLSLLQVDAFVGVALAKPAVRLSPTSLNLEDWVADMIDREIYRQHHRDEYEKEWMEKYRGAVLRSLNSGGGKNAVAVDQAEVDLRQLRKDRKMARNNPAQYCADRCVANGFCDVYEDIFNFSPEEVMEFCTDCVLSEEDEPCEIPDVFFDEDFDVSKLKP